jgi:hypothetical protein
MPVRPAGAEIRVSSSGGGGVDGSSVSSVTLSVVASREPAAPGAGSSSVDPVGGGAPLRHNHLYLRHSVRSSA